jgi:nucleotide-binding universal stress UspA family protein
MSATDGVADAVVVAVDASDASVAGLRWGVDEAARRSVPLTVVHVIPAVPNQAFLGYPESRGVARTELELALLGLRRTIAAETSRAGHPELRTHAVVLVGDVVAELVNVSRDAAMLVVTAHNGPVHRMILGSVCRAVVARARCPVVVVHPREKAVGGPVDRQHPTVRVAP